MDWNEFAENCGPLYPHVINAVAIYKQRVQEAFTRALGARRNDLCSLLNWQIEDIVLAPYADPDRVPTSTKDYMALGAKIRINNAERICFYLSYYPGDVDARFDYGVIWELFQKDRTKLTELFRRMSMLKDSRFADDLWTVEKDLPWGIYFYHPMRPGDFAQLSGVAERFSRKVIEALSECDGLRSLVSISTTPGEGELSTSSSELSHAVTMPPVALRRA